MSHRTQITLSDEQYRLLRQRRAAEGTSLADLVRRAVDSTYGTGSAAPMPPLDADPLNALVGVDDGEPVDDIDAALYQT